MKRMVISYSLHEVVPYINWLYFYHAWQMNRKNDREREGLKNDADNLLREFAEKYHTHAVVVVRGANSDRDDIVLDDNTRLPMLRQQQPDSDGMCWCLADFVRPLEGGVPDKIGIFAATVEPLMEKAYAADPYLKMLSQTLKKLERNHLVSRKQYPEVPPRVEYALTDLGKSLMPSISSLVDWSLEHFSDVTDAKRI